MTIHAFKITRTDGTTHNGFRWPLPMPGERVRVEAGNPTEHDETCPRHEGDGLCVALSARGASSGGIGLASCIGLLLDVDESDILAQDEDKMRVRAVTVTGIFDVLGVVKSGLALNLSGADLRGADLGGVNLRGAYLRGANLSGADLRGADLGGVNLRGAYLRGADLWGADLRGANLRGAYLGGATGRDDWDDLVARGAI